MAAGSGVTSHRKEPCRKSIPTSLATSVNRGADAADGASAAGDRSAAPTSGPEVQAPDSRTTTVARRPATDLMDMRVPRPASDGRAGPTDARGARPRKSRQAKQRRSPAPLVLPASTRDAELGRG